MAEIVNFITAHVKNRILFKNRGIEEANRVPMEVLNDVPMYVKYAIIDLQRNNLLPPKVWEFKAGDEKQEHIIDSETEYNYISLPTDFREMKEFYVEGTGHYLYSDNYHYLATRYQNDNRARYTLLDYQTPDGKSRPRLILYPYPTNDVDITIRYYTDGSETGLNSIRESDWQAVLKKVLSEMGLVSVMEANEEIGEIAAQKMNVRGVQGYNGTPMKRRATYFGR